MTWSAALPEAALRALRTAAGQRALQMTLLMGGLLAIGLLRGERAYAESGTGALPEGGPGRSSAVFTSQGPRGADSVGLPVTWRRPRARGWQTPG